MERDYVPQAQAYTTPYNQLGLLVVFDLSPKTAAPLPDFRDRVALLRHPLGQAVGQHPDYVVALLIPAAQRTNDLQGIGFSPPHRPGTFVERRGVATIPGGVVSGAGLARSSAFRSQRVALFNSIP